MLLTTPQKTTLSTNILANTAVATLPDGSGTFVINTVNTVAPHDPTYQQAIANWYNGFPVTDYWIWNDSLAESDVYDLLTDIATSWKWATYKTQSITEQGAWSKMFMGGNCNFAHLNNRVGVDDIFGGTANGNAQRTHILAVGRRKATNLEKLFAVIVTAPPANTGNDGVVGNRGKTTNPDVSVFSGIAKLLQVDVEAALFPNG